MRAVVEWLRMWVLGIEVVGSNSSKFLIFVHLFNHKVTVS